MLEWSEEDFKAVRIDCFSEELMSTKNRINEHKEQNERTERLNRETKVSGGKRAHKEKLNGNCWAEKYNDWNEKYELANWLKSRKERTEYRIRELKYRIM